MLRSIRFVQVPRLETLNYGRREAGPRASRILGTVLVASQLIVLPFIAVLLLAQRNMTYSADAGFVLEPNERVLLAMATVFVLLVWLGLVCALVWRYRRVFGAGVAADDSGPAAR